MELVQIPIKELDKVWGMVEKNIKSALAYSGQLTDSDFVYELAKEGKFQVWGKHLISRVEEFAKDEGCKMMELIARPGWQKVYNNHGYKRTHVVLEKQIKQEDKIWVLAEDHQAVIQQQHKG